MSQLSVSVDIVRYHRADGSVDEIHRRGCPCRGCNLPAQPFAQCHRDAQESAYAATQYGGKEP